MVLPQRSCRILALANEAAFWAQCAAGRAGLCASLAKPSLPLNCQVFSLPVDIKSVDPQAQALSKADETGMRGLLPKSFGFVFSTSQFTHVP